MKENMLSVIAAVGLVALLIIAGIGTVDTKKHEAKTQETVVTATESAEKTTEVTQEKAVETTEKASEKHVKKAETQPAEKSEAKSAEKTDEKTEEVFSNGNTKDTINMNTVTDFEVDGDTLIIYTNDGSAYEWER